MSGNAHKTTLSKREQSQKWADARPIIRQCIGLELRRQLPGLWVPTAQLIPVGLPKNSKIWLDKEAAHEEDDVAHASVAQSDLSREWESHGSSFSSTVLETNVI